MGKAKPSNSKGKLTKHNKFVRDLIREVVGFVPYERRAQELLRIGKEKRCLKFLKADRVPRPGQAQARGDAGRPPGYEEEARRLKNYPHNHAPLLPFPHSRKTSHTTFEFADLLST